MSDSESKRSIKVRKGESESKGVKEGQLLIFLLQSRLARQEVALGDGHLDSIQFILRVSDYVLKRQGEEGECTRQQLPLGCLIFAMMPLFHK